MARWNEICLRSSRMLENFCGRGKRGNGNLMLLNSQFSQRAAAEVLQRFPEQGRFVILRVGQHM